MKGILGALCFLILILALVLVIGDGGNSVRRDELATQRAQYAMLQSQAEAARQHAQNEAALYESTGYAIKTQADLVDYYARRGDGRAREIWSNILGLAAVGFIVYLALRRHPAQKEKLNDGGSL